MGAPAVLELEAVTVRREGGVVLDRVSLSVAPGRVHVLVGPNGAGKSTLAAAVLGQVAFEGTITLRFEHERRIGYVPQAFAADRTLPITVAEFLALRRQRWPVCFGVTAAARARIGPLLERVGLGGLEARRLGDLSGGQLRRVLIANAIDPAPALLLCDEPASGLDPDAAEQLDRILLKLRDEASTAALVVSHDPAQVRRIADHVTLLDRRVVRSGSADEVLGAGAGVGAGAPFASPGGAA